jgi:hypothetical protein
MTKTAFHIVLICMFLILKIRQMEEENGKAKRLRLLKDVDN